MGTRSINRGPYASASNKTNPADPGAISTGTRTTGQLFVFNKERSGWEIDPARRADLNLANLGITVTVYQMHLIPNHGGSALFSN